jgi:hypothetical protein
MGTFGGDNVVLQFSRRPGVTDGDTEFRVKTLPPFLGGRALRAASSCLFMRVILSDSDAASHPYFRQ